jgi:hypothetical protein
MLFCGSRTRIIFCHVYPSMRLEVIDRKRRLIKMTRNKRRGLTLICISDQEPYYKCDRCILNRSCDGGTECRRAAVTFDEVSVLFVKA